MRASGAESATTGGRRIRRVPLVKHARIRRPTYRTTHAAIICVTRFAFGVTRFGPRVLTRNAQRVTRNFELGHSLQSEITMAIEPRVPVSPSAGLAEAAKTSPLIAFPEPILLS